MDAEQKYLLFPFWVPKESLHTDITGKIKKNIDVIIAEKACTFWVIKNGENTIFAPSNARENTNETKFLKYVQTAKKNFLLQRQEKERGNIALNPV